MQLLNSFPQHPRLQRQPLRVVLRREVFAAVVKEVAARLFCERMDEQLALQAARRHFAPHDVEVLARLVLGPRGRTRVEWLQAHRRTGAVTRDTARVTGPLVEKDRFYFLFEELVVE